MQETFTDLPVDLKHPDELAVLLPKRPHTNTWYNWRVKGKNGVKLRGTFVLGKWYYSLSEFLRFLELTSKPSEITKTAQENAEL